MKPLLGGKGANLAEMTKSVCPFPRASRSPPKSAPITTPTARPIRRNSGQVEAAIKNAETIMGAKFGDPANPMLLAAAPVPANPCRA